MSTEFQPTQLGAEGTYLYLPDRREVLPNAGDTLLAFGGTSGTGATAVGEFVRGGGKVIVVTSRPDTATFDGMLSQLQLKNIEIQDGQVVLARADLSKPDSVAAMLNGLHTEGREFNKVLISAAGGMTGWGASFVEHLDAMIEILEEEGPDKDEQISVKTDELNDKLETWLDTFYDDAVAINFTGPSQAVELIANRTDKPVDILFYDSIFGHQGLGPHFYGGQDPRRRGESQKVRGVLTKYLMSQWLQAHGSELAKNGVYTGELTAPLIKGTTVARIILQRVFPFYPPEIRKQIEATAVSKDHVALVTQLFWSLSPEKKARHPHPKQLFVARDQGQLVIANTMPDALKRIDISQATF